MRSFFAWQDQAIPCLVTDWENKFMSYRMNCKLIPVLVEDCLGYQDWLQKKRNGGSILRNGKNSLGHRNNNLWKR